MVCLLKWNKQANKQIPSQPLILSHSSRRQGLGVWRRTVATHVAAGGGGGLRILALGLLRGDCPCPAAGGGHGSLWLVDGPLACLWAWSGPGRAPGLHQPCLGSHLEHLPGSPSSPWSTKPRNKSYQFCVSNLLFSFIMILLWEISNIRYFNECPEETSVTPKRHLAKENWM